MGDERSMKDKVKVPAIGLIVLGVLGAVAALWGLLSGPPDAQQLIDVGVPAEQAERFVELSEGGGKAFNVVALAVSLFIAWAGLQMSQLRSWTACVVANILVMIPCFTSCCCLLGIPLGVWGLVQLFNDDVKRAFRGEAPPGAPSAA